MICTWKLPLSYLFLSLKKKKSRIWEFGIKIVENVGVKQIVLFLSSMIFFLQLFHKYQIYRVQGFLPREWWSSVSPKSYHDPWSYHDLDTSLINALLAWPSGSGRCHGLNRALGEPNLALKFSRTSSLTFLLGPLVFVMLFFPPMFTVKTQTLQLCGRNVAKPWRKLNTFAELRSRTE